jgi:3-isopropylmalate dehydrogenase
MKYNITLLPGDGIGPEVVTEAVRVLETIADKCGHSFTFTERLMGGCSIDKYGSSLTDETLDRLPGGGRSAAGRCRRAEMG